MILESGVDFMAGFGPTRTSNFHIEKIKSTPAIKKSHKNPNIFDFFLLIKWDCCRYFKNKIQQKNHYVLCFFKSFKMSDSDPNYESNSGYILIPKIFSFTRSNIISNFAHFMIILLPYYSKTPCNIMVCSTVYQVPTYLHRHL